MKHYDYQKRLKELWDLAVREYEAGNRDASTFFQGEDLAYVESIGATPQEIFDFAEDWVTGGEPDFLTFALLADTRRNYFLNVQNGVRTSEVIDPAKLPPKDSSVEGIEWLPRIIEKARAKLHGTLHPDVMYSCGGDRHFLKTHDIHASEFLRQLEKFENDEAKLIAWVVERAKSNGSA